MAHVQDSPSHSAYSPFRMEEATVTDVNRRTYTVSVATTHSQKDVNDIQCLVPYHHYAHGEGVHHLPEIGAKCFIGWPSDNSPPLLLGYVGAAGEIYADSEDEPINAEESEDGSSADMTYKSNRPDLNPGDLGWTGRDGNFLYLRRGGVVQIGSTAVSQRIYLPLLNYIKDFCENYSMTTFGGDISWTTGRQEQDPGGNAPTTYSFHMNEYSQDKKASVRVRYYPLTDSSGSDKIVWDISVSPQGISREDGSVESPVYQMMLKASGDQTELLGGNYSLEVKGDYAVSVAGDATVSSDGALELRSKKNAAKLAAKTTATVTGARVELMEDASSPAMLGDKFLQWVLSGPFISATPGSPVTLKPGSEVALKNILSSKVFLK